MTTARASRALAAARPSKPVGRTPRALTPARLKRICAKIAVGVPQETAAIRAGVPRRTFQDWLRAGRLSDAREPYKSMADAIDAALAVYHESRVLIVNDSPDPRTALQVLERRFPDDWSDPSRGGMTLIQNFEAERRETVSEVLQAARRALGEHPELFARLVDELVGGDVVDGEAVEVGELVAA